MEGFAVELAVPEGTLLVEAAAGLAVLTVPSPAFGPDATAETGFAGEVLAGFAVAFDVGALAGELGTEVGVELGAADAGFATEFAGGTGFALSVCFAAAPAVEV